MLLKLLALFIVVPLVELWLLLLLAEKTNWQTTVAVVILTGVIGTALARAQGWRTLQKIQHELSVGQLPTRSLVDATMIFLAGVLLVTPGLLTDLLGLSLLIPACRRFYGRRLASAFRVRFHVQAGAPEPGSERTEVIDSYIVDEPTDAPDRQPPQP